jgi:hypothetical protein
MISPLMVWTAPPRRHQSAKGPLVRHKRGKPSMKKFIRIGIDLGKNYFQVHALERENGNATTRKLIEGDGPDIVLMPLENEEFFPRRNIPQPDSVM